MNIDELIGLSESQSRQAPLWDREEQDRELETVLATAEARLAQSQDPDVLSSAIQELAAVADSRPEKVSGMLEPVLRVAARLSATSAAGNAFDFVRRLCLADSARI